MVAGPHPHLGAYQSRPHGLTTDYWAGHTHESVQTQTCPPPSLRSSMRILTSDPTKLLLAAALFLASSPVKSGANPVVNIRSSESKSVGLFILLQAAQLLNRRRLCI